MEINTLIDWIARAGIIGGAVFAQWGINLIGSPDKRFKTGRKDNKKSRPLPGLLFLLLGLGWLYISIPTWLAVINNN